MIAFRRRSTERFAWGSLLALVTVQLVGACSGDSSTGGEAGSAESAGTSGKAGAGVAGTGAVAGKPAAAGFAAVEEAGAAGDGGTGGGLAGSGGVAGALDAPGGAGGVGGEGEPQCDGTPVIIASTKKAWALALDGEHVYWTTREASGRVLRAPISGGATETISAGELYPHELAVAGGRAFWVALWSAKPDRLMQASVTGADRKELATGLFSGIFSLNANATAVYYSTNLNVVMKVTPDAPGSATEIASNGLFNSMIVDMVLSDNKLFWTNNGVSTFAVTAPGSASIYGLELNGTAAPVALLNLLDFPQFQLAVDGDNVFWNDESSIYRTSKAGGLPSSVTTLQGGTDQSPIVDLVSDGQSLFYSDGHAVFRAAVTGGGAPELVSTGWDRIVRLAVDDENVYFTDATRGVVAKLAKCAPALIPEPSGQGGTGGQGGSGGQGNGTGGAGAGGQGGSAGANCSAPSGPHGCPEPTLAATAPHAYGLAVDATHVYYSTLDASGTVMRVASAGGSPEPLALAEPYPHDIAVDGQSIFWCLNDSATGHLVTAPKAGGMRQLLANGQNGGVGRVTSDGTFAYYVTGFNGLYRVAIGGGTPAIFASGPYNSNAVDLAVYEGEAFWTNDGLWNANYTAKLPNTAYLATAPISGSSNLGRTPLKTGLSATSRVAVDEAHVFFIDGGFVYRGDRKGGEPTKLSAIAPASGTIVDLQSDGQNLYFADLKAVYRLPVDGGAVQTLTYGWGGLRSIAVDQSNLYFTDYVGGVVMKRPK